MKSPPIIILSYLVKKSNYLILCIPYIERMYVELLSKFNMSKVNL
jgi:hypothetical protein